MPVTLRLNPEPDTGNIRLVYGPLAEAAVSLHVLADPKHHPLHASWVRRCRSLPTDLRQEVRRLRPAFSCGLLGFLCPTTAALATDIDADLGRLESTDPKMLYYELAYNTILTMAETPDSPEAAYRDAERVLDAASSDGSRHDLLIEVLDDPRRFLERMGALLQRYWGDAFHAEWLRIRSTINAAADGAARLLSEGGLPALLRRLHPEVVVAAGGRSATLARPFDLEVDLRSDPQVEIQVSYYVWPHVWVSADPNWPLGLAIPTTPPRLPALADRPHPKLVASLRALGDPTRLNLLRMVADAPKSTQELARLVHMSEPGVSRHLTTLASAGLVVGRREGHYVVYDVNHAALEPLAEALLGYISPAS